MNIGFVSTWLERGASYVTKSYISLLQDKHDIYVYARGGEYYSKNDPIWDLPYVTWGKKLLGTEIDYKHFKNWVLKHKIDMVFFNEQQNIDIILEIKKKLPNLKIGSYIDYYKEDTVEEFWLFDFLICNTIRHYNVFKNHPQCFYVPWGTDVTLFSPVDKRESELVFFHSVGMSKRKGTDLLIRAFIKGCLYKHSKLIIHSQIDVEENFGYSIEYLSKNNIEVIKKTVSAPGLYHLGDIYVYPTTLDGLGLTLYEALACGLPVITTNCAPMNEVITEDVGCLVDVDEYRSRSDGYYWPLSLCNLESLINCMKLYINNKNDLNKFKSAAREKAVEQYNWDDRKNEINNIFENTNRMVASKQLISKLENIRKSRKKKAIIELLPHYFIEGLYVRKQ